MAVHDRVAGPHGRAPANGGRRARFAADRRRPSRIPACARSARFIVYLLAIVAAVTCTFGNLAAYGQTNIKRLLAYSTIAHAGYMIMAVAAAVQLAGTNAVSAREAVSALVFYLGVYVFMNLGRVRDRGVPARRDRQRGNRRLRRLDPLGSRGGRRAWS